MSTSAGKRKVNAKITTDAGVENERSSRKMKFPARIEGILGKLPVAERLELSSFLGGGGRLGAGRREKVCIIGSGNWGSVIAKIVAENVVNGEHSSLFERDVPMWVFEEYVNGEKLSEIVNAKHENIKYLPGIKLPDNVFAVSDVGEAARDATILVFVLPHQFLPSVLPRIRENMRKDAIAVSLIKGVEETDAGIALLSTKISEQLGGVDVSVLMGANVANEVARGDFCETTIGFNVQAHADVLSALFDQPTFRVALVADVPGVELCGALKNVVALAAGFADGLGLGANTKAALIRIGLLEIRRLGVAIFGEACMLESTMMQSCGVADVIATCYGGRNRRCAEAFAKGGKSWEQLETEVLGGQKLQGPSTCIALNAAMKARGIQDSFPLFQTVFEIVTGTCPASDMIARVAMYR